jgi:hypothetical protein
MPRRVEDILPNDRRSIHETFVHDGEKSTKKIASTEKAREIPIHRISTPKVSIHENKFKSEHTNHRHFGVFSKLMIVVCSILALLAIAYFTSTYFARAVFTISLKKVPISIDSIYVASNVQKENILLYKLSEAYNYSSTTVPSIDSKSVSAKASGSVTVSNAYASTSRLLVAGTRFSGPNEKVYKLTSSIMIPGYKTSLSGAIIPGTIKAIVIADQAGAEYNIQYSSSAHSLKVMAYKGGDKYDKIYADMIGNISGGASGIKKTVSSNVLASTTAKLKSQLTQDLLTKIKSAIPAEYYMFNKGYIIKFGEPIISGSVSNKADVSIRGTIYGFFFKKDELITKLVGQVIVDSYNGLKFDTVGLDELSYTLSNQKSFSPEKGGTIVMQLKGNLTLKGVISENELKGKFAGMPLSDTAQILRSYSPVIDLVKSSGQVVPPWSKIPVNKDKISIIIQ